MKEMIASFAKRFTVKAAICNMHAVSWHGKGNTGLRPEDKFDHELHGMEIALEAVKANFEKRLRTYLKRYGMSKVKTWSYWMDE